jgi:hypothetical protein
VLELRTGRRVEVGEPPPPGLLEAVPAGHVAMARQGHAVVLVLGALGGRSLDAVVQLSGQEGASDARAVALAAEALRDAATDTTPEPSDAQIQTDPARPMPDVAQARGPVGHLTASPPDDDGQVSPAHSDHDFLGKVEPLVFARMYSGASTASSELMAGLGTGLGVCVRRQCLLIAAELPMNTGTTGHLDVRYRYPTFLSGFYSRPFSFGRFTPGASIGFLTRLGHFEADMGMKDTGLDTDLGARGSLELGFELASGLDLMTEAGVDLTLDRNRMTSSGDSLRNRGDRFSPWLQAAIRYRP